MRPEDEKLKLLLKTCVSIAVVGCSRDEKKDAHIVPKYLKEHGYRVIPVNPFSNEILGERSFKSLSEIKEKMDIIDIFRPGKECLRIVNEAIQLKPRAVWMQLGIRNDAAAKLAEQNGIEVIMDKCIMQEHKRLLKD